MNVIITRSLSKGFTLIELLIVVVILGILAAVVIPQLSGTTDGAKVESLKTNLARIRTAIDLYNAEHNEFPGQSVSSTSGCTGTAGAGTINSSLAFAEQLTMYTDVSGGACSRKTATHRFGPYLKATELGLNGIPLNPITDDRTVNLVTNGDLTMTGSATPAGWKYDAEVGKFIADDNTGTPSYDSY